MSLIPGTVNSNAKVKNRLCKIKDTETSTEALMSKYIDLLRKAEKAETHEEAQLILNELKRLQNNRKSKQEAA